MDRELHWGLRYKCKKALEIAYKSPNFADDFNRFLTRNLVEYDNLVETEQIDVPSQGLNTQADPIARPLSQHSSNSFAEINFRDPTAPARHKGRPRLPSRLQSSLEVSQKEATKKRKTCGYCGEKGHYRTGCSKAKVLYKFNNDSILISFNEQIDNMMVLQANEVACRDQGAAGVSEARQTGG